MTMIAALLLIAGDAPIPCQPLAPNTPLPIKAGPLTISSTIASRTNARGEVSFNGVTILIEQPPELAGLELSFETGSVGPVELIEKDAKGATLRSFQLSTSGAAGGTVTYPVATVRAHQISLRSINNEGGLRLVCPIE